MRTYAEIQAEQEAVNKMKAEQEAVNKMKAETARTSALARARIIARTLETIDYDSHDSHDYEWLESIARMMLRDIQKARRALTVKK